jgi:hypothetical protein
MNCSPRPSYPLAGPPVIRDLSLLVFKCDHSTKDRFRGGFAGTGQTDQRFFETDPRFAGFRTIETKNIQFLKNLQTTTVTSTRRFYEH